MRVLVMSDTHGWDENARYAVEKEMPFDALLHLGDVQEPETVFRRYAGIDKDIPAYFVEGNCDTYGAYPEKQILELAGHRIFMAHGHEYYVRFSRDLLEEEALRESCDLAIYGHTHVPKLETGDQGILILNPGSISIPRQEDRQPSYMVLELKEGRVPYMTLKYLT